MGLDAVELLMDVEESFDIRIPEVDAQEMTTVGELYDFILSKTEQADSETCLSARTFYDIKRALRSQGIDHRFKPSTQLSEVLPQSDRRAFWDGLAASTQMRLPRLVRSSFVSRVNLIVTLVSTLIIAGLVYNSTGSGELLFIATLVFGVLFALLTTSATTSFATQFDSDIETFKGFSHRVLSMNAAKQQLKHGPMGPSEIWTLLQDLIMDQLGVDRDKVVRAARFVQDLGLD